MKIAAEPILNETDQTITLQLTDAEWEQMANARFGGVWHFMRFISNMGGK